MIVSFFFIKLLRRRLLLRVVLEHDVSYNGIKNQTTTVCFVRPHKYQMLE